MQKQQKRRKKEREEEEEEIGDASSRSDRSFNNDRKYPKKKKSDLVELLRTVSWDWGGEEVDRGELLLRHE